jgi:hypothetical protein
MLDVAIGYAWPYIERFAPLLIGGAFALTGARLMRPKRKVSKFDRAAMGDGMLIAQAIDEVDSDGAKETYLKVSVLMELERLTTAYLSSDRIRFWLGGVYLVAGFFSIAITGTDAHLPGIANTVKFSFAVNIVGEVASGFLIFGGFEAKGAAAYQLAQLIRLEVSQFIAQSQEYYQQAPEERWFKLTSSVENLLLKAILPAPQGKGGERKTEEQEAIEGDPLV